MKKTAPLILSVLLVTLILCSCGKGTSGTATTTASATGLNADNVTLSSDAVLPETELSADTLFSSRDIDGSFTESECIKIALSDGASSCNSPLVSISGDTVTIGGEGVYLITGSLSNGQICVNAEKTEKIQLVLSGVTISNSSTAPIYVKQADKVFITLPEGSKNTLNVTGEYVAIDENNIDSAVFSKEDLTLNGTGTLVINTTAGHGVVSKDELVITGGTYDLNTASHGFTGKDCISIYDGSFTVVSGKDGFHSENTDDTSLGFMYIRTGTFNVNAQTDGFDSGLTLQIDGGSFTLKTGGGSENASTKSSGERNGAWGMWGSPAGQSTATDDTTASAKGFKASSGLILNGGTYNIDSSDDALHSNANVYICGGTYVISSGDDGIHADTETAINGGTLNITKSYEGIEGQSIVITGGSITLVASDDGLNAAGGNDGSAMNRPGAGMFTSDASCYITISGGELHIDASGDGIDSNGNLTVTGGVTYVSGPTNSGNGALDYAGTATVNGGTLVATGASGMATGFAESSAQCSILYTLSGTVQGGTAVVLKDESGNALISFTPEKNYQSINLTCPGITENGTYTITVGSDEYTVEMSGVTYGGSGSGMPGGNFGGGNPGGTPPDRR